jgi:hypothetical protein
MTNPSELLTTARAPRLLWINAAGEPHTGVCPSAAVQFEVHHVCEPTQISAAIVAHASQFLCFEFDEPDAAGMVRVAHFRCAWLPMP